MSFLVPQIYNMMALTQRMNAQQRLMSSYQNQMNLVNQVGVLAMQNPDALNDPRFMNQLFQTERAMTLQNQQDAINMKLYEQQQEASKKLLDKGLQDYGKSIDLIG